MHGIVSLIIFINIIYSSLGSPVWTTKHETKCFDTVFYYYSNGDVGGESKHYLHYDNDNLKNMLFTLSCGVSERGSSPIRIEEVNLLLPAQIEDYCDDYKNTSHKKCTSEQSCSCCKQPDKVCRSPVEKYSAHWNEDGWELEVVSKFLWNCTGRKYDCEHEKCHSRWAEVKYSCLSVDATTSTVENVDTVGDKNTLDSKLPTVGNGNSQVKSYWKTIAIIFIFLFIGAVLLIPLIVLARMAVLSKKLVDKTLGHYTVNLVSIEGAIDSRASSPITDNDGDSSAERGCCSFLSNPKRYIDTNLAAADVQVKEIKKSIHDLKKTGHRTGTTPTSDEKTGKEDQPLLPDSQGEEKRLNLL